MFDKLTTAEEKAIHATRLAPFGVNLPDVRQTLIQILDLFGRNNFFREYTVHNFNHIQSMLEDLEWIIPQETQSTMSGADWLLITLSIYFHDLGLVVTEEEFSNRIDHMAEIFVRQDYLKESMELNLNQR